MVVAFPYVTSMNIRAFPRFKLHVRWNVLDRTLGHSAADRHPAVTDVIDTQPDVSFQHGSALDGAEALLDTRDTALLCGA